MICPAISASAYPIRWPGFSHVQAVLTERIEASVAALLTPKHCRAESFSSWLLPSLQIIPFNGPEATTACRYCDHRYVYGLTTRSSQTDMELSRWRPILAHSILHLAWSRPLLCWSTSRCHTTPETLASTRFATCNTGPLRTLLFEFEIQYTSAAGEHFAGYSHPAQRRHSNRLSDMRRMAKRARQSR